MKKIAFFAVAMLAAAMMLCGCGKKENTETAKATNGPTNAGRTFVLGFDASFPPYGFVDEATGEYKGFDIDLAREVCKRQGWELVLKPIDWDAKDAELNSGTIDCIWNGFTITEERKKQYTWSEPYVQNVQYLLVREGSDLHKLADLNGHVVVAQEGSSGAEAMEAKVQELGLTLKDYLKVPDYVTAKTMLESGAVDAIAMDSAVAHGFIQKDPGKFYVMEDELSREDYGIGFKLGNTNLRDAVMQVLGNMVADGTTEQIVKYWAENEKTNGGDGIDFILK